MKRTVEQERFRRVAPYVMATVTTMLQWTCEASGTRFCLYVHHTDAEREWAYDRSFSIGRLDKGLDEARARGWTVVSMKDIWKRIFAFAEK